MRVLVCGSRTWLTKEPIKKALEQLPKDTVLIEGEARGADILSRIVAEELGFKIERYPAEWSKYGLAAGSIRNQEMLEKGKPELVLAFHQDILNSKGTKDMITRAMKAGIEVKLIQE
jgi:YspA, cpYpsA-related SLOG family